MNQELDAYLRTLLPGREKGFTEMEYTALQNHIPIMDPVSMQFVSQLIQVHRPENILEIGTAIGYSALRMADAYPNTKVTTIEKEESRFLQAKENIKIFEKQEQIDLVYGDALEILPKLPPESFQMVFIDAAKGQYKYFFELSHPLLKKNGIILSDNVLFRGYVTEPDSIKHPRHKQIVKKLRAYNQFIAEHPNYHTSIAPIGDGIAISIKAEGSS